MKKELEDWWMDYDLPVSDVIRIGLRDSSRQGRNLSKPAIQAGIEQVYKENTPDLVIPRWKLAKQAWKYAKAIDASEKRDIYVKKYEGERKELLKLRIKKIRYERIRRTNFMVHVPYWILIGTILSFIYFFRN